MEDRESDDSEDIFLSEVLKGNCPLSRQCHTELLLFELLALVEMSVLQDVLESPRYEAIRVLYKSLHLGRRPDGSSYR